MNIKKSLNISGKIVSLRSPIVMGVINTTPDSFHEDSRYKEVDQVVTQAGKMLEAGAGILDVGGYSTRPGNSPVALQEEIDRVCPAIEAIISSFPEAIVSIDTFRASVADGALKAGAKIVNDISAGQLDDRMFETVAQWGCPYIMMHMRHAPENMMEDTTYGHLTREILQYFAERIKSALQQGIKDIIVDPGFGFSKDIDQNYQLLKNLGALKMLGLPILVGLSRKSMIYKKLGITSQEALNGTSVLNTIALQNGADILRVHDVQQAIETVHLFEETYK